MKSSESQFEGDRGLSSEPNENTRRRNDDRVPFDGDYKTACCSAVRHFSKEDTFPTCSQHGETVWSWIPPFVQSENDFGIASLIQHWRARQEAQVRYINVTDFISASDSVEVVATSGPMSTDVRPEPPATLMPHNPELLLQATIVVYGQKTTEGHIIEAVAPAWSEILAEIDRDPEFLFKFPPHSRKFEELIAGAYEQDNWKVVLTPRSNDGGVDIKATKPGHIELRLFDQVKAISPARVVDADDVRALAGVLMLNPGVQIGVVTTTSRFAPGVESEFKSLWPRLQLRDGKQLLAWLKELSKGRSQ